MRPSVEFYRGLYDAVGREFCSVDRTMMPDAQLTQILHDERVEIYVLYVEGVPAGYAELDRRRKGEIEFAYFDIVSRFRGSGLGP